MHHDASALPATTQDPAAGLTVADVAARYRVSPDKIRRWIATGELKAVNVAAVMCCKPRWVVLPDALAEFERRRAGGPPPKPPRRRRQRVPIDFYP
ncbi:MAG: helix-turn-helix domain-containing protein [Gemmataceae bacterium]|nr:helix-turn-helix domain-containing protein [Gemmataceae bacterium]